MKQITNLINETAKQLVKVPKEDEATRQILKDEIATYASILVQIAIMRADKELRDESY